MDRTAVSGTADTGSTPVRSANYPIPGYTNGFPDGYTDGFPDGYTDGFPDGYTDPEYYLDRRVPTITENDPPTRLLMRGIVCFFGMERCSDIIQILLLGYRYRARILDLHNSGCHL